MIEADLLMMAGVADRARRRAMERRAGATVREVPGGWVSAEAASEREVYPSSNRNRAHFLCPERPVGGQQIDAAIGAVLAMGSRKVFFLLGPSAWGEGTHEAFADRRATEWPDVAYHFMARAAADRDGGAGAVAGQVGLGARPVGPAELAGVLDSVGGWYADVAALRGLLADGRAELHAAFDDARPCAIGMLTLDGNWGYLGPAATEPSMRRRGGQTALIRSRCRSAAARGAAWCVSEVSTAGRTSLGNLRRCGFESAAVMRVFRWEA